VTSGRAAADLASGPALLVGEVLGRLTAEHTGPLRHARTLAVGVGGSEANVAVGLARLGHAVQWAGRVGDDEFGRLATETLRGQGVGIDQVIIDGAVPTALMVREQRTPGSGRVSYYRAGAAGSRLRPGDVVLPPRCSLVHLSGITCALGAGPAGLVADRSLRLGAAEPGPAWM